MRTETRVAFNAYLANQARLNGVDAEAATHGFTVAPTIQQKLESKIQESSDFLKRINIVPVNELSGEKLGLGVTGPIASRTNTTANDRVPVDPLAMDARDYLCVKTNSDTLVKYATLDTWAKFPDFQARLRNQVVQQQALDRLMIGFNGTSIAAATDKAAHPLLQDVNKGWLQHIREDAPARNMTRGAAAGHVYVSAEDGDKDYDNLDALVFDAIELLDPWAREDARLCAMVSRDLMHDKYFPLINQNGDKPTETLAGHTVLSQKRIGGLPGITIPFFPAGTILIGPPEILSIYYQDGARRSRTIDNPKRDQIETYESSNDAYVVENYGYVGLVENITLTVAP